MSAPHTASWQPLSPSTRPRRRLIVNADDFGLSTSINQAVIQAHRRGILTSASLMVNGQAFDEAVALATQNPRLGVGLHLTVCAGAATLPPDRIPALVSWNGWFRTSAVSAGITYYVSPAARAQLREEISAQFSRFERTGLPMDHVNGHLHFHLHPAILTMVLKEMTARRVRGMRITHDPLRMDWRLGNGRTCYRLTHALIFRILSRRAKRVLASAAVKHTSNVFGLLQSGRVSREYIFNLLRVLPPGDSELYSHPCLKDSRHEYDALISPRVKQAIARERIELIRYQDL